MESGEQKLYKQAYLLSLFTIFYNIIESIASVFPGYEDETPALSGFGVDSFIEVMPGTGIAVTGAARIKPDILFSIRRQRSF